MKMRLVEKFMKLSHEWKSMCNLFQPIGQTYFQNIGRIIERLFCRVELVSRYYMYWEKELIKVSPNIHMAGHIQCQPCCNGPRTKIVQGE